jgi:pathogenesis-related protein 1
MARARLRRGRGKRSWIAGALLVAPLLAAAHPPGPALRTDEAETFLRAHNRVRRNATPVPVPPLPPMRWSDRLAESASRWAADCRYRHTANPDVGENLYVSTGDPVASRPNPQRIVESWADERRQYDYADRACSGADCLHYTQEVWRSSAEVGCGIARCEPTRAHPNPFPDFPGDPFYLAVCQYSPPGNYRGEWPYLCDYDGDGRATERCRPGSRTAAARPGS